ncbi:MAG: helix-turn-helix domain-containing protein, partial [Solimonas sp.]
MPCSVGMKPHSLCDFSSRAFDGAGAVSMVCTVNLAMAVSRVALAGARRSRAVYARKARVRPARNKWLDSHLHRAYPARMHLTDLELFVAAARRGSFAAAARERDLDPSSVSRGIAAIEAALGIRLFQ